MASKKKWHDWPNLMNHAGPHTAPNMVNRSADNHSPDKKPHGTHVRGWKDEHHKDRFKRGHPGTTRADLHFGFGKKAVS